MTPSQSDMEGWPVLPEGVEGVLLHSMPADYKPPGEDCFVCGKPMPDVESGEMCWGVPGQGVAHDGCYKAPVDDMLEADGVKLNRCACGTAEIEPLEGSDVGWQCAGCKAAI